MARKELAALLGFLVIVGPLTYFIVKEELRQSHRVRNIQLREVVVEDAIQAIEKRQDTNNVHNLVHKDILSKDKNRELFKRLRHSRQQEKFLQAKIVELNTKLLNCGKGYALTTTKSANAEIPITKSVSYQKKEKPTIFIITPTYKRFVQKSELTRLKQAFKNIENLHWIVVEDSPHKTKLVKHFLEQSGLPYTHLNIRTPSLLRKHRGEARRFKPRGVYQRNIGIEWIRNNVNPSKTQGVVYFADDDNTYDSRIFEEMRWIKRVGVWPVAFTGAARWAGPICLKGKVVRFHTNWGHFRPFPIDMAGFAINIKVLIRDFPNANFKAMRKPGLLESSLLKQITSKKELEPIAENCTKVYVWHTRSQQPRDSILGEKDLISDGRPSDPSIET